MVRDDLSVFRIAMREMGKARPSPNPAVGAVVVRGGRVVARGHHRAAGAPHAEIVALRRAGGRARGATLYTTLEPCSHQGRTPPCTEAIVAAGIRQVVIGARDRNPRVRGGGARRLRRAGIRVRFAKPDWGMARALTPFFTAMRLRRPHVTLKLATSIDGRTATRRGESKWITSAGSRMETRFERSSYDAILVGVETVLKDDPRLDARIGGPLEPARVVLDSRLRTPLRGRLLRTKDAGPVLFAHVGDPGSRGRRLLERGAGLLRCRARGPRVDVVDLLRRLFSLGMISVLVEGGSEVAGAFVDEGLVDAVDLRLAPILIGGTGATPAVGGQGVARLRDALRVGTHDLHWSFTRFE